MKLVVFADLHLDAPFVGHGGDGQPARRRRQALRDTLERIVALAQQEQAEALLCGGDLYEQERCTPDTVAFLQSTFHALSPLPIFVAPGNHDWLGPASVYQRTPWSANVHIFQESRLEAMTLAQGLTLWGAAQRAPANTPGFLDQFRVDRAGIHLALFHGAEQSVAAVREHAPHAPFRAEQIVEAGLHHAFLGHYHRPRDAERHTYPGNPCPLSFGEDGERGAVIATVRPDGRVERARRRVATVDVHDLSVDLTGCVSRQAVRDRVVELTRDLHGWLRLTLAGELAPELDVNPPDLAGAAPWLEGLVVRVGDLRPGYDLHAIQQEPTVRGQFVREVLAAELEEGERRRILSTGLRALDGRTDLEAL